MSQIVVAALYQFVPLPDFRELRERLYEHCEQLGIKGSLLLAEEGINGTVAGSRAAIDSLGEFLAADGRFTGLEYKESFHDEQPFVRLKVKLKKEIVTMGVPGTDPKQMVGRYADVEQWNQLIEDPETLVIDTRNDYEVAIGKFKNAISPDTDHFREFPDYVARELDPSKHKRVAMYCTGGIRCEKATNYMLKQGFEEVYHLKGGILKYLEDVAEQDNRWEGECFVFDERVSVDKHLQRGDYELCRSCRHPLSAADRESEFYERGVSCAHCYHTLSEAKRAGARERMHQMRLAQERGDVHLGAKLSLKGKTRPKVAHDES